MYICVLLRNSRLEMHWWYNHKSVGPGLADRLLVLAYNEETEGARDLLHFESKRYCATYPTLTLQLEIFGKLHGLMGRIVKGCVREVSLAQVSCILYVAPPTVRGRWPWG